MQDLPLGVPTHLYGNPSRAPPNVLAVDAVAGQITHKFQFLNQRVMLDPSIMLRANYKYWSAGASGVLVLWRSYRIFQVPRISGTEKLSDQMQYTMRLMLCPRVYKPRTTILGTEKKKLKLTSVEYWNAASAFGPFSKNVKRHYRPRNTEYPFIGSEILGRPGLC